MTITALRILPPFAIGRFGSSPTPQANYDIEVEADAPLGFRKVRPRETLEVDEATGAISGCGVPASVQFRDGDRIRPVAPFLEVFAVDENGRMEPLDLDLLRREGLDLNALAWRAKVANRKVFRRTGSEDDIVTAKTGWFSDHARQPLTGRGANLVLAPDGSPPEIPFGDVRFIRPTPEFPGIRLRFTPAEGLIYGPATEDRDPDVIPESRAIYSVRGDWVGFQLQDPESYRETLPPALYAIKPPAPSWLNDDIAISRGYVDDACDGKVTVRLTLGTGRVLTAAARICASPPAMVPDSMFIRSLADDLDQIVHGPELPADEPIEVTRARAEDIVRRAYETVRFMNVPVMNGNDYDGRPAVSLDTMVAEEAFDTERPVRPAMAPEAVDTQAILALHQQVFAALRAGAAPWFSRLLRRPDEVTDYTDEGRRKMPALMSGADNNYLALTHRQIATIERASRGGPSDHPASSGPTAQGLVPRNRTAQIHYAALGNPVTSRPEMSVGNCCPGLEVDFRAVWRRLLEGIVLVEHDNFVIETDKAHRELLHHRLLRIDGVPVMAEMRGPSTSDPDKSIVLTTAENPNGVSTFEWSNTLAHTLHNKVGQKVRCDFTASPAKDPVAWPDNGEDPPPHVTHELRVRPFFEDESAVISFTLAEVGELTQGLCSPWQNDYRECSCYYWASSRPDFVNVEIGTDGLSRGDNWMAKERSGNYVADDYRDTQLIGYDDLFKHWEKLMRFQIKGRDYDDGSAAS